MTRLGRGERGAATVEVVLLFPAMILMVWIALGAGMYHWGRTAALNAAQTGAAAAAPGDGTLADCEQAARDMAATVGDALSSLRISCTLTATTATATVSGSVLSLVPGWTPSLTQTATVPVERLT
jgi:Flp pilus assembly protein TadG